MGVRPDAAQLARHRLVNTAQMLLIVAGLVVVLAIPAWFLAGGAGVAWVIFLVALTAWLSGNIPSRLVLARTGASPLRRAQAPGLYALVDRLYRSAGLGLETAVYYVPTGRLNAFAVGTARDGGIAVTDGLVRRLNARQLAGVLAHEVSHLAHNDTRVMSMAAAMTQMTVFGTTLVQFLLLVSLPWLLATGTPVPLLLLLVVAASPTLSTLLQLALSRNREFTADLEAAALTDDPEGLASALEVLERYDGSWLRSIFGREPMRIPWLQTHPPTAERIRRLLLLARRSGSRRGRFPDEQTELESLLVERPVGAPRRFIFGPWH